MTTAQLNAASNSLSLQMTQEVARAANLSSNTVSANLSNEVARASNLSSNTVSANLTNYALTIGANATSHVALAQSQTTNNALWAWATITSNTVLDRITGTTNNAKIGWLNTNSFGTYAPVNGQVLTYDSTMGAWTNKAAAGGTVTNSKSITLTAPGSAENVTLFYTVYPITIDQVAYSTQGSTPSTTLNIVSHTARNSAASNIWFAANHVVTSAAGFVTNMNFSVAAASWIWLVTTATSGTVNDLNLTITYH